MVFAARPWLRFAEPRPVAGRPGVGRAGRASAALLGLGVAWAGLTATPAVGQSRVGPSPLTGGSQPVPEAVQQVEVVQKLGNTLDLDTPLVNQDGKPVRLGDYFVGDRPVILEFAYFDCPMLCPLVQSGISDAARALEAASGWEPGREYQVLTISINPADTPVSAARQRDRVIAGLERGDPPHAEANPQLAAAAREGWQFLVGREKDVAALADAVGFGYAAVPNSPDFAHGAVLAFVSPDGAITRYLPGHVYPQRDFRMAVVEASAGQQGSLFDMVLQLCYHYDDQQGTYTADALMLMKIAGGVTLLTMIGVIGGLLFFERRRQHHLPPPPAATDSPPHPASASAPSAEAPNQG